MVGENDARRAHNRCRPRISLVAGRCQSLFGILSAGALLWNARASIPRCGEFSFIAHSVRTSCAAAFSRSRALFGNPCRHAVCRREFSFVTHSVPGWVVRGLVVRKCWRQGGAKQKRGKCGRNYELHYLNSLVMGNPLAQVSLTHLSSLANISGDCRGVTKQNGIQNFFRLLAIFGNLAINNAGSVVKRGVIAPADWLRPPLKSNCAAMHSLRRTCIPLRRAAT